MKAGLSQLKPCPEKTGLEGDVPISHRGIQGICWSSSPRSVALSLHMLPETHVFGKLTDDLD